MVVEYPNGGERLVPSENEKIRWTANGEDANTLTAEYSLDNGGTWNIINSSLTADAKYEAWAVPNTSTNDALIRVKRNSGSIVGTSGKFSILGVPVITLTNICNGAIEVNWTAVAGATSYDVMIKNADSMRIVTNTTALSYIINNLPANTLQWITVRAVNSGVYGRRGIAKSMTPNSGGCSNVLFDNDLQLTVINQPNTGRQNSNTSNRFFVPINFNILNRDDNTFNSAISLNYSINGGATVTENITPTIAAGGTITHSFAYHSPSNTAGNYMIKIWLTNTADANKVNDTIAKEIRLLNNAVVTLPFFENFEAIDSFQISSAYLGIASSDRFDFETNAPGGGRLRTKVYQGFAYSGKKAITLDQYVGGSNVIDTLKGTFNLSAYDTASHQLRLKLFYRDLARKAKAGNKIWIRGNENATWIEAFNYGANLASQSGFNKISLNINEILLKGTPTQQLGNTFQLGLGAEGEKMATYYNIENGDEDGTVFDDIKIDEALNDLSVTEIVTPKRNDCNTTSSNPITVKIRNYSGNTLANIAVSYRVNNGAIITENIPTIAGKETLNYTFAATANLGSFIDYSLDCWLWHTSDTYNDNDSVLRYEFHNSPLVNSFPYLERFETDNGNWFTAGQNNSWQYGTPTKSLLNRAANGTKIWTTSLTANYNDNELSYLTSPCFNLSGLTNPSLSFSFFTRIEDDCPCDYAWMEYSADGGLNWSKLGAVGQGTNWYDNAAKQAWQISKARWHVSTIPIPTNATNAKFRFVMQSDGGVSLEGLGVDDVHIYESKDIYSSTNITSGLTQNLNGSTWVDFTDGNKLIASIQPNGNNLGNTEAKVYFNTTGVRNSNSQYYADRNIVIQPTNQPSTSVKVRFYFSENDVVNVLNATGCGGCSKPMDAYDFGITKYSGTVANENGTLDDNNTDTHTFILPGNVNIVPYMNGYYAEYTVNSFSEFWLNNGGIGAINALPYNAALLTGQNINNKNQLNWQISTSTIINKVILQRSFDAINFSDIATLNNNISSYIDQQLSSKKNTYKLKIVSQNGATIYSNIITLDTDNKYNVQIGPNPTNGILNITANSKIANVMIYNSQGKLIISETNNGNSITLNLSKNKSGVYIVKCYINNEVHIYKIIIN